MKPAIAFFSGSLVPAIAIFWLGGTPLACFVAGCLTAVIPALLFARKLGGWLYWVDDAVDALRRVRTGFPAPVSHRLGNSYQAHGRSEQCPSVGHASGGEDASNCGQPGQLAAHSPDAGGNRAHSGAPRMRVETPRPILIRRGPRTHTTSAADTTLEVNELETALINLNVPKKQAKSIAAKLGPGLEHFAEAVNLARGVA